MGFISFMCLLSPIFMQKNRKKVMSNSKENGVSDGQTQPAFTCSKLTIETLVPVLLLSTLKIFHLVLVFLLLTSNM